MTMNRRHFLKSAIAASGALGASALGFSHHALAQTPSDYRALVCVFLYGGMDSHDVVLPFDSTSYNQIADIRASLFSAQGQSRSRSALLALNADNASDFGTRQFALASEMPGMSALFDQGRMAVVGNVGPLIEPTTAASFDAKASLLPPKLFSHNDQQNLWQANSPEGALDGWGGLFSDAMLNAIPGASPNFSAISTAGNSVFLTGLATQPFSITSAGGSSIRVMETLGDNFPALTTGLEDHFRAVNFQSQNLIAQDVANKLQGSYDSNATYNQVRAAAAPLATAFPASPLGGQLNAVANAIAIRSELSAQRQVFFVGIGGFDTHSAQAQTLPALLGQIDGAVAAFYNATVEMGVSEQVTLFTASDFGRTLAINGDGTDHGWGAHHFVVGGGVRGRRLYGEIPPPILGHDQDAGNGRLVPTISVEQYASTLGRWFGVSPTDVATTLPNLGNFATTDLGFMG